MYSVVVTLRVCGRPVRSYRYRMVKPKSKDLLPSTNIAYSISWWEANKNTNKGQMRLTTNRLITRAGLGNRHVSLTTPVRSPPTVLGLCPNQLSFVCISTK